MSDKLIPFSLVIAGLSLASAWAVAAPGDDVDYKADSQAVFKALDTNHDDRLSAAEMTGLPQAIAGQRLAAIDSNHDGQIDRSEFAAAAEAKARARAERRFARMDQNQDNMLTAAEMTPPKAPERSHHKTDAKADRAGAAKPGAVDEAHQRHGDHHHHGHHRDHGMAPTDEIFAHMDRDQNGFVSVDEWQQAAARWHHHRGSHHPGAGGDQPPHDRQSR